VLGRRLASELKETGQEFELSEAELETLPAIKDRFQKPKKCSEVTEEDLKPH
jgi:hypothetical protein